MVVELSERWRQGSPLAVNGEWGPHLAWAHNVDGAGTLATLLKAPLGMTEEEEDAEEDDFLDDDEFGDDDDLDEGDDDFLDDEEEEGVEGGEDLDEDDEDL